MGQETYVAPPPPRQSSNRTCCLWGCLVSAILGVLVVLALGLSLRSCMIQFRENYTATAPTELPSVQIDQARLDALTGRVEAFTDQLDDGEPAAPIELTQDEINALIQNHPDWEELRDKVYVTIEDDVVTGEVSIPLDFLPMFGGRYFNGSVTLDVNLEDGRLEIYVESASVGGEPVPQQSLAPLTQQNLAADFQNDPDVREILSKLDSIEIRDGKVIITPKQLGEPAVLTPEMPEDTKGFDLTPEAPMPAEPEPSESEDLSAAP